MKKEHFFWIFIIILIFLFHLMTIDNGHNWGGDFALYIMHAQNICNGKDYKDTKFIYNEFSTDSPESYPPLYPILLAPVYKIWGFDLKPMKIEIIIFLIMFLILFFYMFRNIIDDDKLIIMILLIGLNPFIVKFKNNVISDIPFMFFTYLSLFCIDKLGRTKDGNKKIYSIIIIGSTMYLMYAVKSVGIGIIPSLIVLDIIRNRKISIVSILSVLVFLVLMNIQLFFIHSDKTYYNVFAKENIAFIHNILFYFKALTGFFENGYSKILKYIIFLLFSAMAGYGFFSRLKNISIYEIFSVFYIGVLLVWPLSEDALRHLLIFFPLFLFYIFGGYTKIKNIIKNTRMSNFIYYGMMIMIFASYFGKYSNNTVINSGVTKKESSELFKFIRKNTLENDIIAFVKPRTLALFSDRRSIMFFDTEDNEKLWDFFKNKKVTYIIDGPYTEYYFFKKLKSFHQFINSIKSKLKLVYSNHDFNVYKIIEQYQ